MKISDSRALVWCAERLYMPQSFWVMCEGKERKKERKEEEDDEEEEQQQQQQQNQIFQVWFSLM